jgi:hypothetical protein
MKVNDIIINATSTLFGDVKVMYELEKCIKNNKKFKIQINGFSGNWANIKVELQEGNMSFKHYTLKPKP